MTENKIIKKLRNKIPHMGDRFVSYTALLHSCWPSSYNGNVVQPTQKRFNSAYLQNKFCICQKIASNT